MSQLLALWYYQQGRWETLTPTTETVADILALSKALYIVIEDIEQTPHLLYRDDITSLTKTEVFLTALDNAVLNNPQEKVPELSTSSLVEIKNVELKDGIVRISDNVPHVFNTTTSYETTPFNGGSMVLDYLDNVFATNDVTLGYLSNIKGFTTGYLSGITLDNIHAALLVINDVMVKVSDYFVSRGNIVYPKSYTTEALMSLLVEAEISPRELGIVGVYKSGCFKSRQVVSNLIKHPKMRVLIHPDNMPVELYRTKVDTTLPYATGDVIFRGNKPSTLKALGLLSGNHYTPKTVSNSGVHLSLPETSPGIYYQVSLRYLEIYSI